MTPVNDGFHRAVWSSREWFETPLPGVSDSPELRVGHQIIGLLLCHPRPSPVTTSKLLDGRSREKTGNLLFPELELEHFGPTNEVSLVSLDARLEPTTPPRHPDLSPPLACPKKVGPYCRGETAARA